MANSSLPDAILLEDAVDLCDFLEAAGRTIPRGEWADEVVAKLRKQKLNSVF